MQDKIITIERVETFTAKSGKEYTKTTFVTETGKTANTLDLVKVGDEVELKNDEKWGWQGKLVKAPKSDPAILETLKRIEAKLDKLGGPVREAETITAEDLKKSWANDPLPQPPEDDYYKDMGAD